MSVIQHASSRAGPPRDQVKPQESQLRAKNAKSGSRSLASDSTLKEAVTSTEMALLPSTPTLLWVTSPTAP